MVGNWYHIHILLSSGLGESFRRFASAWRRARRAFRLMWLQCLPALSKMSNWTSRPLNKNETFLRLQMFKQIVFVCFESLILIRQCLELRTQTSPRILRSSSMERTVNIKPIKQFNLVEIMFTFVTIVFYQDLDDHFMIGSWIQQNGEQLYLVRRVDKLIRFHNFVTLYILVCFQWV